MNIKFDYNLFNEWFELNNMSRNKVIKALGQRDPNKVSRWLAGQIINTEDLIGLCNHYDLQIADFLIITDEEECKRIKSAVLEKMKERRKAIQEMFAANVPSNSTAKPNSNNFPSSSVSSEEMALAKQSIAYEKRINEIITDHVMEMKDKDAYMRQQLRERAEIINALQSTISTLSKEIENKQKNEERLQDTIHTLQMTIQQQQDTIASYDAIIRKQKKIPSQTSPFYSGQVTMVQDGGGAISAAPPQNND